MRNVLRGVAAAIGLILATQTCVAGKAIMIPSIAARVAQADCVVIGTVTSIEDKPVQAIPYPGVKDKVAFQIAVIKIDEALLGVKGLTTLRVGIPPQGPRIGRGGLGSVQLAKGQELCLFLHAHPEETFYTTQGFFSAIDKKSPNFARESADAKRYAQMLNEPMKALKAKSAEDRYLAGALLVLHYRSVRPGLTPTRTKPIDAAESKLIMAGLAEGDWTKGYPDYMLSPQNVFNLLGEKKGWTQPTDFKQFATLAQKWLKDNTETHRIERYLVEDGKK